MTYLSECSFSSFRTTPQLVTETLEVFLDAKLSFLSPFALVNDDCRTLESSMTSLL